KMGITTSPSGSPVRQCRRRWSPHPVSHAFLRSGYKDISGSGYSSLVSRPSRKAARSSLSKWAILHVTLGSWDSSGTGSGCSSFWTLFVAFLYSAYAFLTWPFRHLFRLLRHRKAYGKAQIKRAVILGFDGMDPELASRFIAEGKLPNLAKLRDQGTFRKLRTTLPPISPVAWSTFMT